MKAVVYSGTTKVQVQDVEEPRIEQPTDVVIRITSSGICGSDLHMYEGRTEMEKGQVLGHENMGVIEQVGPAVRMLAKGDRVVIPFNIGCGSCFNCVHQNTHACLYANPESPSAGYGYSGMGPYRGGQAELLRVPWGEFNCLKVPGTPQDELEDDFLLLSDVFPTGFHATELARVRPGSTVAVFGAGPVGLLSAYSAKLKGASEIYVVDSVPERLAKVKEMGWVPIDFTAGNPVEQIQKLRKGNARHQASLRPGEEKLSGVMCGIDAVGYQARDGKKSDAYAGPENPSQIIEWLAELVNPAGAIGLIGVYLEPDPKASGQAKKGTYPLPLADLWEKAISIGMGQCPVKRYNAQLRDLIIAGIARPSFIVSHRIALEEAPEAYKRFDARKGGYTKVIIKPGLDRQARA
jgi:glutathione-independent formaldehyde dehydrogenase